MGAQAQQAGPGADRGMLPVPGLEAAGPASPRLVIEEVGVRVDPGGREARVVLSLGSEQFRGTAHSPGTVKSDWQLVAAASVGALQQCLQQHSSHSPTPRVELLDAALTTTGLGQEVIHATLRLAHGSESIELLGSVLVRNDRRSTAAAATLNAVSRRLQLCRLAPGPAAVQQVAGALPCKRDSSSRASTPPQPHARRAPLPQTALGIHVDEAAVHVTAIDPSGKVLAQASRGSTTESSPGDIGGMLALALEAAEEAVRAIASSAPPPGVLGLAVPARFLDRKPGRACSEAEVDVAAGFRERFGFPVKVITSQGAAAIAEHRIGAAQGAASLLFAEVGDDIEVALVSGGQTRHLFNAGHLVINSDGARCRCGQRGCWQALAGYEGLVTRVLSGISRGALGPLADLASGGPQAVTATAVCRLAAGGDALARDVVEETGRYLALGLANLVSLLGPEVAIIAGSPAPVAASLRHAAEVELKLSQRAASLSRCVFLSPQLGETGPAIGAAIWASSQPD